MSIIKPSVRSVTARRQGSITVMAAVILTMLIVVAAFTINLTQLSTARVEMRVASDAAATGATIVLGETQDLRAARQTARQVVAEHRVNGRSIRLTNREIDFGHSEMGPDGMQFHLRQRPFNSVRVRLGIGRGTRNAAGNYFLDFLRPEGFDLQVESTAAQLDHDLCLVVDRSGSMAWDVSGVPWRYPPDPVSGSTGTSDRYFDPPHPTDSRWAAVDDGVDRFLRIANAGAVAMQVGLVSYAGEFSFGNYQSESSTIEQGLTEQTSSIRRSIRRIGRRELVGATNIAAGMLSALEVLTGPEARASAKSSMVVLTDGQWNRGLDPVEIARQAADANITVHSITFGRQADQDTMRRVAEIGGGVYHDAKTKAELIEVFERLAMTLPPLLTD